MAGFEPALSCSRSRRISQAFPHPGLDRPRASASAQRESNPHFRHGKAVGCHYNMGTDQPRPNCQRDREHRVGVEPTSPHYGCGVFATRPPVPIASFRVGPEGLEPSPTWLRARRSATRALVPSARGSSRPGRSRTLVFRLSAGCSLPLSYGPSSPDRRSSPQFSAPGESNPSSLPYKGSALPLS
jgi:hypothetical protein